MLGGCADYEGAPALSDRLASSSRLVHWVGCRSVPKAFRRGIIMDSRCQAIDVHLCNEYTCSIQFWAELAGLWPAP
jgi:hypothetical protein